MYHIEEEAYLESHGWMMCLWTSAALAVTAAAAAAFAAAVATVYTGRQSGERGILTWYHTFGL